MKFTLSWLKEHLETQASLEEITDRLTMLGLELEGVVDRAQGLEDFVVAHVVRAEKHPNADKLQVCTVDTGREALQVVCGAPNARAGMKGVFAASGMAIPGTGIVLKKAEIRGVESNGMLLSEREMGLSDAHDGIVDLSADAPVGARAVDVMGLADPVIDIAVTPNRGDCLSVRGVARDLAASGLGKLKAIADDPVPGMFESPVAVRLDFPSAAAAACPYFVGRMVRGVNNGPSPKWLRARLEAIGLRPISALVDITNLMTFEYGRPLHVFDADKVEGGLTARLARNGESLKALDGKTYALDDTMTVIADARGPAALGGVIGGEETGCAEGTVNVFIESALFDPVRTATTGRKLNVMSDARYRFERGIDQAFAIDGMEIATRLILDLCGGEPSQNIVAGAEPSWRRTIAFRPQKIKTLAGVDVPSGDVHRILTVLGFVVFDEDEAVLRVDVPSWRGDIVGEACLVEEVVRVFGYDHIPTTPLRRESDLPETAMSAQQMRRTSARRTLAARGLNEAVSYSFMAAKDADLFGGVASSVRLVNPISSDLDVMRPSIAPNLLAAIGRNDARGVPNGAMFEVGPQFSGDAPDEQTVVATALRAGQSGASHWARAVRPVDAFDAKADALAVLGALGVAVDNLQTLDGAPSWYHPGRSGRLCLGPKNVLAVFGELHPGVLKAMDVRGPVVATEIFIDSVPLPKKKQGARRALLKPSPFQPVDRDFAFVVDLGVPAQDIVRAVKGVDRALIAEVGVFDVFTGPALGEGKKSLAVRVTLQPYERTLTEDDIDAISARIVAVVAKNTDGVLRA
ncbi:phenylalanine--tRNA ligase subunit beta [Varunaivibrio sulfuroxidans]|uniref:Phenylalanine--tRNA ligase beta subunit n=1 Tax=Varunaivibrio sulfuroxidans TaxID=1773489 RepID=A0A4R3J5R2_9PROT|nr:phenylalanine--tRNA ligase subunit beta [Varunaivibrio sulfuroxidans]TCS60667.1 phenylalanyl-tRNA synthetase beta subunit [Varunaivibrio sulfuroxidans]WES30156.1 phenylalanine--tRNA ligase subunit beta [Varunaivibrio sulfuroxidans]